MADIIEIILDFLKDFFLMWTIFKKSLLNLLQFCFYFMFWFFGGKVCGILTRWPGIEPTPSALEDRVLTSGPLGIPGGACGKESASQCRSRGRCRFDPWVGKIPLRRKWHPTPVFLPEKFHGQRSLVSYSPWGRKEFDKTEAT